MGALAASANRPFAGPGNVRFEGNRWTDSISHGELLRAGYDEHLEVDPARLRFVFQGVSDELRRVALRRDPVAAGTLGGNIWAVMLEMSPKSSREPSTT